MENYRFSEMPAVRKLSHTANCSSLTLPHARYTYPITALLNPLYRSKSCGKSTRARIGSFMDSVRLQKMLESQPSTQVPRLFYQSTTHPAARIKISRKIDTCTYWQLGEARSITSAARISTLDSIATSALSQHYPPAARIMISRKTVASMY